MSDLTAFPGMAMALQQVGNALVCIALGGVFATLFSAYTLTGQVGVRRLAEKYPKAEHRLTHWAPRWDVIRFSLMLCSVLSQIGVVVFALLPMVPTGDRSVLPFIFTLVVTTLCLALVFHVLPRALSRNYADRISVASLPAASLLTRLLFPLAWPVASMAHLLHRVFQEGADEEDRPSTEEQIRSAVNRASLEELEEEERQILESVFDFGETVTREIMTPRVDIQSLEDTETVMRCADEVKDSPHSRFPVYHESLDDVRGMVHVKDLLRLIRDGKEKELVGRVVKGVPFIPESMPINDLLTLLRSEKSQSAIVVDEYGGTAGLVTMEDILEELVGEIMDEYDKEDARIHQLSDGSAILDARTPVYEVNELLDVRIPENEDYDSAGGFVFHELGRIPRPGEVVQGDGYEITIQTASPRQLHTLRILKKDS